MSRRWIVAAAAAEGGLYQIRKALGTRAVGSGQWTLGIRHWRGTTLRKTGSTTTHYGYDYYYYLAEDGQHHHGAVEVEQLTEALRIRVGGPSAHVLCPRQGSHV